MRETGKERIGGNHDKCCNLHDVHNAHTYSIYSSLPSSIECSKHKTLSSYSICIYIKMNHRVRTRRTNIICNLIRNFERICSERSKNLKVLYSIHMHKGTPLMVPSNKYIQTCSTIYYHCNRGSTSMLLYVEESKTQH